VAQGQTPKEKPGLPEASAVISTITLEGFQKIVQAMGFETTSDKDANGQPVNYFYFQAEGYRVVASMNVNDVVLLNVTTGKFLPTAFNEWNKGKASCCFVWLDDDGLAYLATDVSLDGGITRAALESSVKHFRDSVAIWKRFLGERQVQETPTGETKGSPEKPSAR
jgi:hypothetical protein